MLIRLLPLTNANKPLRTLYGKIGTIDQDSPEIRQFYK